jgi:hypothetical protein
MRLIDRLLNRPLSQDAFAKMLVKRIRASGDSGPLEYDSANFRVVRPDGRITFLSNTYQEYLRLEPAERETLIQAFLTTWHTSSLQVSDDFADVRADILPALRARSYLTIDIQRAAMGGKIPSVAHEVIGEHLALCLVYDLPTSMMTINDEQLEKWDVSFYEALEVAKQNLTEKTTQYAQLGPVYSMMEGDSYDATRMVLLDFIRQLNVSGDPVAMVPNRDRLYITGSNDDQGLEIMADLAAKDLEHERWISGMPFRLEGEEWQPWLPPKSHGCYPAFKRMWMQTLGQTYAAQAEVLNAQNEKEGRDIFVATYSGIQNEKTGELASYCVWSDGVDSLLPETDQLFLFRPHAPEDQRLAARGEWDKVQQVVGDLMEPQDTYPERWRVREFPDAAMLERIGLMPE